MMSVCDVCGAQFNPEQVWGTTPVQLKSKWVEGVNPCPDCARDDIKNSLNCEIMSPSLTDEVIEFDVEFSFNTEFSESVCHFGNDAAFANIYLLIEDEHTETQVCSETVYSVADSDTHTVIGARPSDISDSESVVQLVVFNCSPIFLQPDAVSVKNEIPVIALQI